MRETRGAAEASSRTEVEAESMAVEGVERTGAAEVEEHPSREAAAEGKVPS